MKRLALVATGWWMLFGGWSAYAADPAPGAPPSPPPNAHQMQLEVQRARLDSDQKMAADFQAKAEAARALVQSDQAALNALEHPAVSVQQMPGKPMMAPQSSRPVSSPAFGGAHPAAPAWPAVSAPVHR